MIERAPQGYRLGLRTAELGGAFAAQFNQVREFYAVCDASDVLAASSCRSRSSTGPTPSHRPARGLALAHRHAARLRPAALSATGRACCPR
jgi:hypothetical protein